MEVLFEKVNIKWVLVLIAVFQISTMIPLNLYDDFKYIPLIPIIFISVIIYQIFKKGKENINFSLVAAIIGSFCFYLWLSDFYISSLNKELKNNSKIVKAIIFDRDRTHVKNGEDHYFLGYKYEFEDTKYQDYSMVSKSFYYHLFPSNKITINVSNKYPTITSLSEETIRTNKREIQLFKELDNRK